MSTDYLDFDIAIGKGPTGYLTRVVSSPAGCAEVPFVLPFEPTELAQFMVAVGPPRVASRRLVPVATRLPDVRDYGTRLGAALLSGPVGDTFRASLAARGTANLRVRLNLDETPELRPIPWEYLYDQPLARFLTLSSETPVVRLVDAVERPPPVTVEAPLRILVMIASPSDLPSLAVDREEQLLRATTADLVKRHQLELTVLRDAEASLSALQLALLEPYHVFHFIGHGGFDTEAQHGVLALERPDGTAHRVDGDRLGTLLHDASLLQLAVLNACEGARSSGHDAFSGVAQALVRQGLPAVVGMQTEISDRAALVFTHELYAYLTRGLPIDAAICEVRKAMAISDEAAEWGTAVLLRSGAEQPFTFPLATTAPESAPKPEERWTALYEGAQGALAAQSPDTALPMLEQLAVEHPDYEDVTQLLER
ncbi:MAG: CHAT domain-containing protein, partial [Micrococcales bacterium]|nr:CHAT domain-containing protein [Micrococcales bacterium]